MNKKPTGFPTSYSNFISSSWFVLILTAFNTLLYHYPLALYSLDNIEYASNNGVRTLLTLTVIVFVVTAVLLFTISLFSTLVLKISTVIFSIANSIALYFIITYSVILDKPMMANVFNTRSVESLEFLHPKMLLYIILLGLLPAFFIVKTKVKNVQRFRALIYAVFLLCFGLAFIYINASTALWFDKHSRKLGGAILPWSYVINSARVQLEHSNENVELTLLPLATSISEHKTVVVLVIGETARASNFSLYGYDRQTNPLLSKSEAIALQNVIACSTYTTASIHCMLSHDGSTRGPFEPLPSYLQRNQVDVVWRTRNWGEPALEVEEYVETAELRTVCSGVKCDYDELLLTGLADRIRASDKEKVFVVLHTKGSHGPSYHTRYPIEFEAFKPVCKSVELDKCTSAELANAYDNTIVYTDYFLAQTIAELRKLVDTPTAMIYISDHGESLGEYGLYLHGTPNAIAPAAQREIPFIIWMSESFEKLNAIGSQQFTQQSYSHSNIFHSVLGAFGVRSSVYKESLDIFNTQH